MKKKIKICIILFAVLWTLIAVINHYKYRQVIGNLQIVHYISGQSPDLNYLNVHLNVVLPKEKYFGNITMNVIRVYVIIRHEKIPDYIEIVIYDSMESLSNGKSYAQRRFDKD